MQGDNSAHDQIFPSRETKTSTSSMLLLGFIGDVGFEMSDNGFLDFFDMTLDRWLAITSGLSSY